MRAVLGLLPIFGLATALAQSAAPAPHGGDKPRPIRIGFICPFTGGSQDFGNSARLGAELAAQEINEVGGYLGRPVELVERDDRANPDEGRKAAEDLVLREKVDFTIGYCNSGVALKSLDVFQANKSVLVVPVATNSTVATKIPPNVSYIFRMAARDEIQSDLIVSDLLQRGLTRVAIFADKTGYGEGGLKDVTRLLAAKGLQPAYVARFGIGVKSLAVQMTEARSAGADAIVGFAVGPEQAIIAESRARAKFYVPQYGPWTLSFRSIGEAAGSSLDGAMTSQTIIQDPANERSASFIARLRRQAGNSPIASMMSAAQTCDAVHLMLRAVFQTKGDTSGDALKHALENFDHPYHGVITVHEKPFSVSDHEAFSRNMICLGVWRQGEVRFLYPQDAMRSVVIRRKEVVH